MKYIVVGAIITIVFVILLCLLLIRNKKIKIKDILLKVDEAEETITILLKKKSKSILAINEMIEEKSDKVIIEDKDELSDKDFDNHEFNKVLNDYYDKIIEVIDYNNEVILDDEESKEMKKLKNISLDLIGTQKYYNDNIAILNKYAKSFPTSLFTSSKKKEPYINEKSEIFEILKD